MAKRTRCLSPLSVSKKSRSHSAFAPIKIATAKAAAAVDADLPLQKLLDAVKNSVTNPQKGQSMVYWMRMEDLRIVDNRALAQASKCAAHDNIPLVVLFVLSPQDYIAHDRSKRRIDFTLRNLSSIKKSLDSLHIPLHVISHTPRRTLPNRVVTFLESVHSSHIFANIEYEVDELRRDINVCHLAKEKGIKAVYVHDRCVVEPGVVLTKEGRAYTVYSPFQRVWIANLNKNLPAYLGEAELPKVNAKAIREDSVLGPLFDTPVPEYVEGFKLDEEDQRTMEAVWPAGTDAAMEILSRFLHTKAHASHLGATDPLAPGAEKSERKSRILSYNDERDKAERNTTSRLSPYLSAGVISARACIRATMKLLDRKSVETGRDNGVGRWVQEIAWRDFYNNILAYFPRVSMGRPFQEKYASVVWEENEEHFNAWKEGRTGVPIVDAAMRQANTMGWMHNRMRMIVAMFLSKDLMLDWRLGERYFMQTLIDGDLASNNGGWQWSTSTGVDSAPYFRIFNPYSQSNKADPTGEYIRHFVPELKDVRGPDVHNPSAKLADKLGYPRPIVKHEDVRERALRRYKSPGEK